MKAAFVSKLATGGWFYWDLRNSYKRNVCVCVPTLLPRSSSSRKEVALRVIRSSCCCQSFWRALVLFILSWCELQRSSEMVPLQRRAYRANLYLTDNKLWQRLGEWKTLFYGCGLSPLLTIKKHTLTCSYSTCLFCSFIRSDDRQIEETTFETFSLPSRKPWIFVQYKKFQI